MKKLVMPMVYPLQGVVTKCFNQFYGDLSNFSFPPPGQALEVCFYELREDVLGTFERENCDVSYLAWLMALDRIALAHDDVKLAQFIKSSQKVSMNFHKRANDVERLMSAYQLREHEEASADMLGHSILQRARELSALQVLRRKPANDVRKSG